MKRLLERFAITIPDDRDPPRRVEVWSPFSEGDDVPTGIRKALARDIERRWQVGGWTAAMGPAQVVGVVGGLLIAVGAMTIANPWVHWTVAASGVLVLSVVLRWVARRSAAAEVRHVLLAASRCPSCGYDLTTLPPGALVTCPECDAAWHLDTSSGAATPGAA